MQPREDKSDRWFLILFAGLIGIRVLLLLTSQHSICGDEASVGVTAQHILVLGERPVFARGEHYNGGAAVTAYLATIPFRFLGMTETALKLVPLALGLLAVLAVYLFVRSSRPGLPAVLAAGLYGTTPCLMKWGFDARGGYAEGQVLVPLALWLLQARCLRPEKDPTVGALLQGLLCGFGFYLFPLCLPLGVGSFLLLIARAHSAGRWAVVLAWLVGGLLGGAALILFHGDTEPLGGHQLLLLLPRLAAVPLTLLRTLASYLPRSLAYANLDGSPPLRLAPNDVEYLVLLLSVTYLLIRRRQELTRFGRSLLSRSPEPPAIEGVLLPYAAVYLLLYSMHPLAGEEARHLLFLEPALSILTGLGLAEALSAGGGSWLARGAAALLALTLANRAAQYARLAGDDGVYGPLGRSDPRAAGAIIGYLDSHGADRVMSEDWDLSWRVVFKTGERITATHSTLWLGRLLRDVPEEAERYAVIVDPADPERDRIRRQLAKHGRDRAELVAGKEVYLLKAQR